MNETTYKKLLNAAFRFVSYRPRSEKELRDYLVQKLKSWKTYAPTMVEKVIARMVEYGHIDDEKFARWWRQQRVSFRPKGPRVIALELKQHGVPRAVIEAALGGQTGVLGPYNELEVAQKAVAGKLAVWSKLSPLERKTKLFGFLARRGFSSGTIRTVIDEEVGKRYNNE